MRTLLLLAFLAACSGTPDKPADDTGGGGDDTGPAPECNTDNEACEPGTCGGEGAQMLPGSDCVSCHSPGSGAAEAGEEDELPVWTVAGTAFADRYGGAKAPGATVRITGADGEARELTANSAGNFYSRAAVALPYTAAIEVDGETREMFGAQEYGGCNSCHACEGEAVAKLY